MKHYSIAVRITTYGTDRIPPRCSIHCMNGNNVETLRKVDVATAEKAMKKLEKLGFTVELNHNRLDPTIITKEIFAFKSTWKGA